MGVGDSIISPLPIRRRFLLDIAGADRVDIFIDCRASSIDQFDGIFEMRAVVGVWINFVEKDDCSTDQKG